ncbi:MAG: xanthine dehydrogenase family protein molybdopterin-binding subunit, partial [Woeseiaceae bacterium]
TRLENIRQTVELSDLAAEKDVGDYKVVGQSVPRLDIPAKVFGGESFLQDLRLPGMVHGRVVRPPAERARLRRARTKTAEGMPGVLEIVVDGTFVGVIAEREGQARAAAEQLRRDLVWNLPGDMPDAQKIGDWLKQARSRLEPVASSVLDFGSSAATRTIRATYQRPYQAHASISPSAAIARFHDGRLDVYSHAQGMYPLRRALARALGMQERKIDCHHREASGCFGHNGADDAACDAAVLARALPGTPVRVQWERGDEFAWEPYGSAMRVQLSADIDRDNTIRSWNCDLWSCPHSSRPRSPDDAANLIYAIQKHSPLPPPPARSMPQPSGGADRNAIPLYDFDNIKIVKHLVEESPLRVSALRGLGAYANVFAIESFMDELANRAREDPLAYRLRHLDNPRAIAMLEQLADVSGWHKRSENKEEGWGIAFAQFKNLASYTGICVRTQVIENRIRLVKAIAVCDAGLIINPDGVRAQIEGGIIQSSSWTLKEHVRFSRSEKQSLDWASYPILRFDEVPDVEVHLVERRDSPPLGVGEAAQGPTAVAIATAVFDQTGQRLRQLPLVLQHV